MSTPAQQAFLDSPEPTPEVMGKARTVALIVHGVGDHSQINILDSLDYGLQRTLPPGSFEATRLRLSKVLLPSGSFGDADVTRIQTSGVEHFVIPVIWSREHLRAEPEIKYQFLLQGSSIQRLQLLIMRVARPLVALCLNSFRCIPKATGAWKLALAASYHLWPTRSNALAVPLLLKNSPGSWPSAELQYSNKPKPDASPPSASGHASGLILTPLPLGSGGSSVVYSVFLMTNIGSFGSGAFTMNFSTKRTAPTMIRQSARAIGSIIIPGTQPCGHETIKNKGT
jgi:hypothetical protein